MMCCSSHVAGDSTNITDAVHSLSKKEKYKVRRNREEARGGSERVRGREVEKRGKMRGERRKVEREEREWKDKVRMEKQGKDSTLRCSTLKEC